MGIITALIMALALIVPTCLIDMGMRLYNRVLDAMEWRQMRKAYYPKERRMYV